MLRFIRVRYSAKWPDETLMYPGVWVETWALVCPGVWMLVKVDPETGENHEVGVQK